MFTLKDINTRETWKFDSKEQASKFIHSMSFGFEWLLLDENNNIVARHIYE